MAKHIAVYPGTFDPITNGHLDIIERGLRLFDGLVIAIAESPVKEPLFTVDERIRMVKEATKKYKNVKIESFNCLLIDYIHKKKANIILRGLRVISDFEYEFQMALTNRKLAPDIETVFMMTAEGYSYLSSRFIKEIARLGGRFDCFVPPNVAKMLKEKF
ncbi:MAG: pantetheine-phosphate adenylyltransferase [Deltaproteobacteria bacterium RIFCSPLOWO2_12_FULL_43_16]|nr:MAG: pantetheine-phosphate adenylyltransferase [Deltaproteobacteria bacterium GWA2_43_19]OGQ10641.1 MAG: pantetheine-phosphate adenylyltransferase [Deltaproteobacteria bacterium RIFCSPHIGHO2_02_FULL_43_33]OGQ61359.1 MAG: pantetheine-phosphate adenylyltransferase [Deltaproteobacteria bacterium RIFCSPLOWO2_12_FULL_43_16]HBR17521.1 pantetheine-phosphate adenylyltransferase [Deltaproteobacteria bacterium]